MAYHREVGPGEFIVVPRGVEHCPLSLTDEVHVLLLEPKTTLNTGNVFVRPMIGGKRAPSPATATLRGFNVAHATGAGMEWWGVSDVSADVLQSLVARLARGPE